MLALHDACAEQAIAYLWDNSERVEANSANFAANVEQCMKVRQQEPPCKDDNKLKQHIAYLSAPCNYTLQQLRTKNGEELTWNADIDSLVSYDDGTWALSSSTHTTGFCTECYWPLVKAVLIGDIRPDFDRMLCLSTNQSAGRNVQE